MNSARSKVSVSPWTKSNSRVADLKPALLTLIVCRPGATSVSMSGVTPTATPSSSTFAPGGRVTILSVPRDRGAEILGLSRAAAPDGVDVTAGPHGDTVTCGADVAAAGITPRMSGRRSIAPRSTAVATTTVRTAVAVSSPACRRGGGGAGRFATGRCPAWAAGLAGGPGGAAVCGFALAAGWRAGAVKGVGADDGGGAGLAAGGAGAAGAGGAGAAAAGGASDAAGGGSVGAAWDGAAGTSGAGSC